ncbi:M14 family metallopeptidase [Pseudalkalibacillus berkeleyi]|uniref:M14 family metallocarboxypeptidase n=1 Tax=Pseudalkalibacillus berkeleyi TaxID=1069813 RepID=A0ABS9H0D1_9BACL|nr:M14 family metallocarboxypeptidase [Pseudalkalibacillus berkeleyi]MCF6138447.1 M14 family metallocarboxypeptidase [Pseudalkalibacillus berkeleyi]
MQNKKLILILVALLIVTPFLGDSGSAEEMPYFGKEYAQPDQVMDLYPEPNVNFETPAFLKEDKSFTTQEEMESFIQKLDDESDRLKVKNIGQSIEGRNIPALFYFKKDRKQHRKPTVWLQGQIHGNEPAGGESALVMAKMLTEPFGDKVLDKVNVIIIPRVNPDGAYAFERRMANGLDGNRDHIKYDLPEIQAIHTLYNQYDPEVTIDAHEYSVGNEVFSDLGEEGYLKYHDLLILSGKNLNIPEKIRNKSNELFVENAQNQLSEAGFSNSHYYVTGREEEHVVIKEGGTASRIGRNGYGLTPSFSFLVESRGIGIGRENYKRRVAAQVETHKELIQTTADKAKEIKKLVWTERAKLVRKGLRANDQDQIVIEDTRVGLSNQTLEVVDVQEGRTKDIPVKYFSSSKAEPTLTRDRPTAYLIKPDQKQVVHKLKNSGLEIFRLPRDIRLPVESYTVTEKEDGGTYESHPLTDVKTEVTDKNVPFEKGTYVVMTAQHNANLASVALEPESDDSYVTFNFIQSEIGEELPIYRFVKGIDSRQQIKSIMKNGK